MQAFHTIETPTNAVGAVSIVRIVSSDLDDVFSVAQLKPMKIGQIRLASVFDLDDALIARFDEESLLMMPHGGIGITRAISNRLSELGIAFTQHFENTADALDRYPEAMDIHEARMLEALSIAPSPLAVDVLLDQPKRWRDTKDHDDLADAQALNRLLRPPLVVAVGRANIGKSSLVNALAGVSVAMVSDHAGTTRDHVGVMLDLGGLVVRWVDTPGIDERAAVGDELDLVKPVIGSADLIIHAIDHAPESDDHAEYLDPRLAEFIGPEIPMLKVGVRSDMSHSDRFVDCSCSSKTGEGIQPLAQTINQHLISPAALTDPRPWRFWES